MKKQKFRRTAEGSERRAMRLVEEREQGELSPEELLDALERLREEGPSGPFLDSQYASAYIDVHSYDYRILRFIDGANRRYPRHPALSIVMILTAEEFGLDALILEQCGILVEQMGDEVDTEEFQALAEGARKGIEARGAKWESDRRQLLLLDEARWDLLIGRLDEANEKARRAILDRPTWLPALRIQAEIAWDSCRLEEAERIWRALQSSGNPPAFDAPLARFLYLTGRFAEAEVLVDRIIESGNIEADPTLIAELALATGRGAKADRIFGATFQKDIASGVAPELFIHLVGGIALAAGDKARAKGLWESIEEEPVCRFSEANLRDLALALPKRMGPFLFRFGEWLPSSVRMAGQSLLGEEPWEADVAVDFMLGRLRTDAAALLPGLARLMLRLGDLVSLRIFLRRLSFPWFPELDSLIAEECRVADLHPFRRALIESELAIFGGRKTGRKAERETVAVNEWSISWESSALDPETRPLMERAHSCLKRGDFHAAERLFLDITRRFPESPAAWGNLRYALNAQGRSDEVEVVGLELRTRFPGYYQTQLDVARELAAGGDRERALRIVQGLLSRDAFHGSVLRAVISTMIDLLMEDGHIEAAAGWYSMWKEFEPDPEKLEPYASLELLNAAAKLSEDSERRAAQRQLRRRKKAEGNNAVGAGRRRRTKTGDNPGQQELF